MKKSLSRLIFIILLSGLFGACAHQSVSPGYAKGQKVDCARLPYDSVDREHCYQYRDEYEEPYEASSEAARIFGYTIFRVVVEGLVHGIIHH